MQSFRPDIILRSAQVADEAFIFGSFLKTHYQMGTNIRGMRRRTFEKHHRKILDMLMHRGQMIVACDPGMPEIIYGWILFERIGVQLCIHYCYVRGSQRRFGIGSRLYEASRAVSLHDEDLPVLLSHLSPKWRFIDSTCLYNPYAMDESHHNLIVSEAVRSLGRNQHQEGYQYGAHA